MDENNTTEQTAIQAAIKYFNYRAPMNCGVMCEQYTAVAEWLQELAAFKDETPITRELLEDNFDKINDELYNIHLECDIIDIYIQSEGIFHIIVKNKGNLLCHTLGQLRMFMTICGLGDFVKQLKA